VLSASDAKQALQIAETYEDEIHLVLTDVIMPEMNGRELVKEILPFRPRILHLFMSGYTADVLAPHGVIDEGTGFLHKPFSKAGLLEKVKETLGVRLRL